MVHRKIKLNIKISQKDVYNQYLAYHQGWGGYKKGVKKQAIKDYAAEQGREQNPSLSGDPDKVLIRYR